MEFWRSEAKSDDGRSVARISNDFDRSEEFSRGPRSFKVGSKYAETLSERRWRKPEVPSSSSAQPA